MYTYQVEMKLHQTGLVQNLGVGGPFHKLSVKCGLKKIFGHKTCTLVMQDQTGLDTMDLVIKVSLGEEGLGYVQAVVWKNKSPFQFVYGQKRYMCDSLLSCVCQKEEVVQEVYETIY